MFWQVIGEKENVYITFYRKSLLILHIFRNFAHDFNGKVRQTVLYLIIYKKESRYY